MRIGRTLPPAAAPISIRRILTGFVGWHGGEKEICRFRDEIRASHGTHQVFLTSSGKAALFLILRALSSLQPTKDEVVIPAFTCYSVPSVIIRAGLRVRLCDINPETLDFDDRSLEAILSQDVSQKILAIVPTHAFGIPSDVGRVNDLVKGMGVTVVEDAAQSMGVKVEGQRLGTLSDVGFFSLGRGKAFSTVAGGVIVTSDRDIALAIEKEEHQLQSYRPLEIAKLAMQAIVLHMFMHPFFFWFPKALPFLNLGETHFEASFAVKKMSGFQAGLSRGWEKTLRKASSCRELNSQWWGDILKGVTGVKPPAVMARSQAVLRYPLLVAGTEARRALLKDSNRMGLGIMPSYPDSLDRVAEVNQCDDQSPCLNAHRMAIQLVTLPVHEYVNRSDRLKIRDLLFTYGSTYEE